MIDRNVFDSLYTLLGHSSPKFRKEIAWSISNIMAGGVMILEQFLNHKIFDRIIYHLNIDDFRVIHKFIEFFENFK